MTVENESKNLITLYNNGQGKNTSESDEFKGNNIDIFDHMTKSVHNLSPEVENNSKIESSSPKLQSSSNTFMPREIRTNPMYTNANGSLYSDYVKPNDQVANYAYLKNTTNAQDEIYNPTLKHKEIFHYLTDLIIASKREKALHELSRSREILVDIAPVLWHSFGIITVILQEIISIYPLLSPPKLTAMSSNRVCDALALLQCVASHPETRKSLLNSHIIVFLYPFLNTVSMSQPFEYLRLTTLGVIGALFKVDDPSVVAFLLQTEIISLCLRIMETGSELSKTVATFIIQKIITDDLGLRYVCATAERFYAFSSVLGGIIMSLIETPSARLYKQILKCYLRLADNPKAREGLRKCLPYPLKDRSLLNLIADDATAKQNLLTLLSLCDSTLQRNFDRISSHDKIPNAKDNVVPFQYNNNYNIENHLRYSQGSQPQNNVINFNKNPDNYLDQPRVTSSNTSPLSVQMLQNNQAVLHSFSSKQHIPALSPKLNRIQSNYLPQDNAFLNQPFFQNLHKKSAQIPNSKINNVISSTQLLQNNPVTSSTNTDPISCFPQSTHRMSYSSQQEQFIQQFAKFNSNSKSNNGPSVERTEDENQNTKTYSNSSTDKLSFSNSIDSIKSSLKNTDIHQHMSVNFTENKSQEDSNTL